jgi:hypothetical protein
VALGWAHLVPVVGDFPSGGRCQLTVIATVASHTMATSSLAAAR